MPFRILKEVPTLSGTIRSAFLYCWIFYYCRLFLNDGNIAVGLTEKRDGVGGVRNHISGIEKYSRHKIRLLPNGSMMKYLSNNGQFHTFRKYLGSLGLGHFRVVHSHVDPQFINLCFEAKKAGTRWIHTYHTLYFEDQWEGGLKEWQKVINQVLLKKAKHADVKISISQWLHDYLLEYFNIDTIVIPNGVDLQKCKRANPSLFRSRFNLSDFILFVGSMSDVKNPKLFIMLAETLHDTDFVMIGKGLLTSEMSKYYGAPLPQNLHLLGPFSHEDVLNAIAACSVFVITSKSEGLPTAMMEAMGLGKPVVGPDDFGCKDLVMDERFGYLFRSGDLVDLVLKVKRASLDKTVGARAQKRIRELFDWKVVMPKIDEVYSRLSS